MADKARDEFKRYGKRDAKVAKLNAMKGAEGVSARKELRKMRDTYYSKDPMPSAGMAWKPNGHNMARGKQTMRKSAPK